MKITIIILTGFILILGSLLLTRNTNLLGGDLVSIDTAEKDIQLAQLETQLVEKQATIERISGVGTRITNKCSVDNVFRIPITDPTAVIEVNGIRYRLTQIK